VKKGGKIPAVCKVRTERSCAFSDLLLAAHIYHEEEKRVNLLLAAHIYHEEEKRVNLLLAAHIYHHSMHHLS
jgi:hypothetical protein